MRSYYLTSLLSTAVVASPLGLDIFERAVSPFCSTVSKPCNAATHTSLVTSYCSSYLSVPLATETSTTTKTSTLVLTSTNTGLMSTRAPAQTITKESTTTIWTTKTTTLPTTSTSYTSSTVTTTNAPPISFCYHPQDTQRPGKLKARAVAKPTCLSKYTAAPQITSACSCYSIPKSTVTSTSTALATTTSWTTVHSGKTTTIFPTETKVLVKSITSTKWQTAFTTTTVSAVKTVTSTNYPVAPSVSAIPFGLIGSGNAAVINKWAITPNPYVLPGHDDRDEFTISQPVFGETVPLGRSPSTLFQFQDYAPASSGHIYPITGVEPLGSSQGSLYRDGDPRVHFGSVFAKYQINCKIVGQANETCGIECWDPFTWSKDSWNDCYPPDEGSRNAWLVGKYGGVGYADCPPFVPYLVNFW